MAIQQYSTISLSIVGDGSSTAFTYGLNKLMIASVEVGTFLNMDTVPSGATFHNDGSSPINATATVDNFGNLTITFVTAPANNQQITFYCDLLYAGSGSLSGTSATWTNATALNTVLSVTLSGAATVVVPVIMSGTVTGGAIVFEASPDNVNWFTITGTIPANFQPISSWSGAAGSTMVTFDTAGYVFFRARLQSALTGSSPQAVISINSLATTTAGNLVSAGAVTTYSTTAPTPSNGSQTPIQCSPNGNLIVQEFRRAQTVAKGTTITSAGATTILAAQGAGVFADLTSLTITTTPVASSNTIFTVTIGDGTNTYIFDMDNLQTDTRGIVEVVFNPPLPATTANTAWTQTNSSATPTTHTTVVAVKQTANF